MSLLDEHYLQYPCEGKIKRAKWLSKEVGYPVGKRRIKKLMEKMGLATIYPKQIARSNHDLQTTQCHLMETEEQFSTLLDGLTATENTFAQSLGMKEKIHQLSDLQQQTNSPLNPNQLITENILLKQQIRDLQTKAADTRELLMELSEENHALRKLIPTPEPQRNTPSMTLFGSK